MKRSVWNIAERTPTVPDFFPSVTAVTPTKALLPPPAEGTTVIYRILHYICRLAHFTFSVSLSVELPKVERKPKKNTGFLSLFRKGKKKPETVRMSPQFYLS